MKAGEALEEDAATGPEHNLPSPHFQKSQRQGPLQTLLLSAELTIFIKKRCKIQSLSANLFPLSGDVLPFHPLPLLTALG